VALTGFDYGLAAFSMDTVRAHEGRGGPEKDRGQGVPIACKDAGTMSLRNWGLGTLMVGSCLGCGLGPRHFRSLDDRSAIVRARAVGLGKNLPDPLVIPALIERLNDRDPVVRLSANEELRRRTGQDFGFVAWLKPTDQAEAIGRWRSWWQTQQAGLANSRPMP
jgi:hypothetical protein